MHLASSLPSELELDASIPVDVRGREDRLQQRLGAARVENLDVLEERAHAGGERDLGEGGVYLCACHKGALRTDTWSNLFAGIPFQWQVITLHRPPLSARKAGPEITALLVPLTVERPLEPVRGGGAPKAAARLNPSAAGVRGVRGTGVFLRRQCDVGRDLALGWRAATPEANTRGWSRRTTERAQVKRRGSGCVPTVAGLCRPISGVDLCRPV